MMTMILMTLSAFANDDFMSDLEASIAQEQAEDAQPETAQKTQAVTAPVAPSFEEELSFELPAEAIKVDVSIEMPDADVDVDVDVDSDLLAIEGPDIEEIAIDAPSVETETLNIEAPSEIESQTSTEANALDWEFDTDSF